MRCIALANAVCSPEKRRVVIDATRRPSRKGWVRPGDAPHRPYNFTNSHQGFKKAMVSAPVRRHTRTGADTQVPPLRGYHSAWFTTCDRFFLILVELTCSPYFSIYRYHPRSIWTHKKCHHLARYARRAGSCSGNALAACCWPLSCSSALAASQRQSPFRPLSPRRSRFLSPLKRLRRQSRLLFQNRFLRRLWSSPSSPPATAASTALPCSLPFHKRESPNPP
jgi:hypothetical protein